MTHITYKVSSGDVEQRPLDKMYFVVFGLVFGIVLASMGGTMAYMVWMYEIRDDYTSLAEKLNIPTQMMSLVLLTLGGIMLVGVLILLIALRCDCSKPQPKTPVRCPELASSTQVLTISRETLRT